VLARAHVGARRRPSVECLGTDLDAAKSKRTSFAPPTYLPQPHSALMLSGSSFARDSICSSAGCTSPSAFIAEIKALSFGTCCSHRAQTLFRHAMADSVAARPPSRPWRLQLSLCPPLLWPSCSSVFIHTVLCLADSLARPSQRPPHARLEACPRRRRRRLEGDDM
jgi:hypothetical protein